MHTSRLFLVLMGFGLTGVAWTQGATFTTPGLTWTIDNEGRTSALLDAAGVDLNVPFAQPMFRLQTEAGLFAPESITLEGDRLHVRFSEGAGSCVFSVTTGEGCVVLKLADLETAGPWIGLRLGELHLPKEGTVAGLLNAWRGPQADVALMGLSPAVRVSSDARGRVSVSEGVTAYASFSEEAKVGKGAARLVARNASDKVGHACWYKTFDRPLDIRGHQGIGAWVHGDGKGELLKIQLNDGSSEAGHWRDYYITIDFTGWKYCELPLPEGEAIDYGHITVCNLYYNGLPPGGEVECLVDDIRALRELTGEPSTREDDWVLADFEDPNTYYFELPVSSLRAECLAQYGTEGAGVAVSVCPAGRLAQAIEEVEAVAGLPSPRFDGRWSKTSPDVERSYLFINGMGVDDTDLVIDFARKCGFSTIMIGSGTWTHSEGHFPISEHYFPNGISDLKWTMNRFREAGFRPGLHFLGPSIHSTDAYVTPVPDRRLVHDFFTTLAADIDETADTIPSIAPPADFPEIEGGYMGNSSILRIGDELIRYGATSLEDPVGFVRCERGYLGTTASAHRQGEQIAHVKRSYNYFLHDMDTDMTAEVAARLAGIANEVGAGMLYFDGSEALQGPHWHYNAKLHQVFYEALGRDDILFQASSCSHYSYHILARQASADGFADWKAYLDERLPSFIWMENNLLPLDLGWYGIYRPDITPDQVEYVCQKALGYDCSVSIQINPQTIRNHPRIEDIIRIIRRYEDIRLSGGVPDELRAELRKPGVEFLLDQDEDESRLRRAVWSHELAIDPEGPAEVPLQVDPALGTASLGLEFRACRQIAPGPEYHDADVWMLEDFEDLTPYGATGGELTRQQIKDNEAGNTSEGVTQSFEAIEEGARVGTRCGSYTATSSRTDDGGWSAVGRKFDAPLDLREHTALGLWLHGDESGARFKVQLRDARGMAQDYYIPVNFSGWRYIVLQRPEKPTPHPIEYHDISYLSLYYNGIPAGKTCTVLVDGIKALRRVAEVTTALPRLAVDGEKLSLDARLGTDDVLVYRGGDRATIRRSGKPSEEVAVTGTVGPLPTGEAALRLERDPQDPQSLELMLKTVVVYE